MPNITLITPPDKLLNSNTSILLVKPSDELKSDLNEKLKDLEINLNIYLYETVNESWLIDAVNIVDHIILDIDNIVTNQWVIGYILAQNKTFYLTNAPESMYNIVNVNRIYELKQFMEGVKYFGIQQQ